MGRLVAWIHRHSYYCWYCKLPRFILRFDHAACIEYWIEHTRRQETNRPPPPGR